MSMFGMFERKTDHRYFEERLSAYLDGALLPQEQDAVERHLAGCQACQWDVDTLRQTVQWTRELPTLPVPRVFTVPAPVQPERATRRRWSFLPVLQGATALIALLLFFAVAGDFWLGSFRQGAAPEMMLLEEPPPAAVKATKVVELEVEEGAPTGMAVVVETVVVEKEVVVEEVQVEMAVAEPTQAPMPEAMAPTEAATMGEAIVFTATLEEGAREAKASAEETEAVRDVSEPPTEEAPQAEVAPPAEPPAEPAADTAVAGGEPTPTVFPTPLPTSAPSPAPPTVVAEAGELAPAVPSQRDEARVSTWREPGINWLRVTEVALGVAFVLLATATLVFMIQRRRAG